MNPAGEGGTTSACLKLILRVFYLKQGGSECPCWSKYSPNQNILYHYVNIVSGFQIVKKELFLAAFCCVGVVVICVILWF